MRLWHGLAELWVVGYDRVQGKGEFEGVTGQQDSDHSHIYTAGLTCYKDTPKEKNDKGNSFNQP